MSAGRLTAAVVMLLCVQQGGAAIDWTLYLRHAGPLRIGMTLAEARRALGDPGAHLDGLEEPISCGYLESKTLPKGLGVMFFRKRLARFDMNDEGFGTARGARVGMSEDEIRTVYSGRIKTEPHYYSDGHYLNYDGTGTDKGLRLVFETDHGKVTSFRAGTLEAVAFVEGCL